MSEATTPPLPEPIRGGSYSRDPVTGELTRLTPDPDEAPQPDDVQAPAQPDQPSSEE